MKNKQDHGQDKENNLVTSMHAASMQLQNVASKYNRIYQL